MGDFKNMTESELVAKLLELCGERDILAEKLAMLNKEEECLRREYNTDWNMWYHTKEGLKLFHKKWDKGSRGYHAKEGELLKRIREMSGAVAKIDRAMCSAIRDYRNAKYNRGVKGRGRQYKGNIKLPVLLYILYNAYIFISHCSLYSIDIAFRVKNDGRKLAAYDRPHHD